MAADPEVAISEYVRLVCEGQAVKKDTYFTPRGLCTCNTRPEMGERSPFVVFVPETDRGWFVPPLMVTISEVRDLVAPYHNLEMVGDDDIINNKHLHRVATVKKDAKGTWIPDVLGYMDSDTWNRM